MGKKYIVKLSKKEREHLRDMVSKEKMSKEKRLRAYILLKADTSRDGCGWTDERIAESFEVSVRSIERIRKRLVLEGFERCLERKSQAYPSRARTLDGAKEARLVALCCESAPAGHSRWTLQLLTDRLIALEIVERVSLETVRQCLKKMS